LYDPGFRHTEGIDKGAFVTKSMKVILWGREDVLGSAVELFLNTCKEWEVIRISETQNSEDLIQQVEKVAPHVVILYQGDCASQTDLPMLLIQDHPGLKVIMVSLENNSMEMYHKQKIYVKEVSDLLTFVES
jgi:DNA-binding NarL/FixJ family response regulator